jgi:hypothetical protein
MIDADSCGDHGNPVPRYVNDFPLKLAHFPPMFCSETLRNRTIASWEGPSQRSDIVPLGVIVVETYER